MLSSKAERHWDGFGWWNLEKRSKQPPWNLQKYDEISLLQLISDYIDHFSWTNFHDWKLWTPGEWLPRRPWSILTFKRRRDLLNDFLITLDWPVPVHFFPANAREPSGLPWILAIWIYMNLMQKQSEVEGLTYLGCCPPIGLAAWSFLKDFYPSEVHFGFKASETSLFY